MSYKQLWIDEYDRIYYEALDEGESEKEAISRADRLTDNAAKDRFADMVDRAKDLHDEHLKTD